MNEWHISVPEKLPKLLKIYRNCLLMVKGLPCDFRIQDSELYHKVWTKEVGKNDATKRVHSDADLEIQGNENWHYKSCYVLFPDGIMLDNQIFSYNDINVETIEVGMKLKKR